MLEVIGLENENKWLDCVKQFHNHDVYYLPQYTKAFQIHGDGEPLLFYYESKSMKAINVVMKRDISQCEYFSQACKKDTCFDITTPYGYGGFLIEDEKKTKTLKQLNKEYSAYCRSHGIVSEFVRFHPLLKNHFGLESLYELTEIGKTISLNLFSPEIIYSKIKSSTRNRIRKAELSGIKIVSGNTWDMFSAFKEIYDKTMSSNNAQQYYYFSQFFYKSVMNDLKDNVRIFYATLNNEIIAIEIVLFCNKKMHIHLTGSKKEYLHFSPIALLYYKTALWGYENSYKTLHLGGGVGAQEDSLYKFKSNFNKDSGNRFVTGKKIFDNKKYEFLLEIRKKDPSFELNPEFFPEYKV